MLLDEGEEVGVAPDAPLTVCSTTKRGEGVAGVFAGFASGNGSKRYFEEVPADGEIAADSDLLHVGATFDRDDLYGGAELCRELFTTHRRSSWSEEDYVVGDEVKLRGEVALGGGLAPGGDEGADLLVVLFVGLLAHFFVSLVSFSRAVRTMSLVSSSGRTSAGALGDAGEMT